MGEMFEMSEGPGDGDDVGGDLRGDVAALLKSDSILLSLSAATKRVQLQDHVPVANLV